jgi:hypothetical protein
MYVRYLGPRPELIGRKALARLDEETGRALVQFDLPDRCAFTTVDDNPLCFGWHDFSDHHFERVEP